jgi:Lrp/AsnC family transcriptional regulator, leucine-responsive regulatory protein
MLDSLDYKILRRLVQRGRSTWSELASLLHLSAPSIADRVKRLEDMGIIRSYTARLDYQELGIPLTAFVAVSLSHPKYSAGFLKGVTHLSEIEECHHIAGDDDYLLKVRCRTTQDLNFFLNDQLKRIPGVVRTRTTIVLSTVKESATIPEEE